MRPRQVCDYCALDATSTSYLEHVTEQMNFSARAHNRIQSEHSLEAIQYRSLDRKSFS
jgi:magnesium chelatase family protein